MAVIRLDEYIVEKGLEQVAMIHIDAEGFEYPVLRGLERFFNDQRYRPPIICEINPRAYGALGITRQDISDYLDCYGYGVFSVLNPKRRVNLNAIEQGDVLLLPHHHQGV